MVHPQVFLNRSTSKLRTESCTQKYLVSVWIIQAGYNYSNWQIRYPTGFFQLSSKSGIRADSKNHYLVHPYFYVCTMML